MKSGVQWLDSAVEKAKGNAVACQSVQQAKQLAKQKGQIVLYVFNAAWTLGMLNGLLTKDETRDLHKSDAAYVHLLVYTSFGKFYSNGCALEWVVKMWRDHDLYFLPATAGNLEDNFKDRPRAPPGDVLVENDLWAQCTSCQKWRLVDCSTFKTATGAAVWTCPQGCEVPQTPAELEAQDQ